eukprot:767016-Hanusia_phi.AAC.4
MGTHSEQRKERKLTVVKEAMSKNSTNNASEMRELQLSFLEDVRCNPSFVPADLPSTSPALFPRLLFIPFSLLHAAQELECDESLKDTYQFHHDVLPEYYLPQSGGGPGAATYLLCRRAGAGAWKEEKRELQGGKAKVEAKRDLTVADSPAPVAGDTAFFLSLPRRSFLTPGRHKSTQQQDSTDVQDLQQSQARGMEGGEGGREGGKGGTGQDDETAGRSPGS